MVTGKQEIISHYSNSIKWVKALEGLSEEQWRASVGKDKWSVAEVVGHLVPWDEFVLKQRIPYFFSEEKLPMSPSPEKVNGQASSESRKNKKKVTIDSFILARERLLLAIINIEDELWSSKLSIGTSKLTLNEYFYGLVQHDIHHFNQIRGTYPELSKL